MQVHSYFPKLNIAVSNRSNGSFRSKESIERFLPETKQFPLCYLTLEHSDHVEIVQDGKSDYKGDAIISTLNHSMIGLVVADCFPCVIIDREHHTLALIHCGWKSLVQNIIQLTIDQMLQIHAGSSTKHFSAWIGPGISLEHYLHTPPVLQQLLPKWQPFIHQETNENYSIDLAGFIQNELTQAGIAKDEIIFENTCTYTNKDQFFSFTRAKKTGDEDGRFFVTVWPTT